MTLSTAARETSSRDPSFEPIAIIGMAGRFPGAGTVEAFWRNIVSGADTISRFAPDELEGAFEADVLASPAFVPARPILADPDLFDAAFFGMYPREAALTDPQHRIFLEIAWEALEAAGYDPAAPGPTIGVMAGCSLNTYFLNNVCADRRTIEAFTSTFQLGDYPVLVGAGQDFLSTRVAYKLDLRGPAMTLGTACSTSLTAVVQACQALQLRQADIMLAGGVSITFPQKRGYLHQPGGMASADGTCRPFDAKASGTVFGSGAAAVVLKRLNDAIADRDTIHAVIRGASSNNDGSRKVGFTAPSIDGQVDVIRDAQARAGIEARSVGYVECHGTATPLGDPIEVAALVRAFSASTADRGFCALGSAKANVGHLDAAAGVTGLIKATLGVRDGVIPPLAHFETPNPLLELEGSAFVLDAHGRPWLDGDGPRRAGVTALGVGGTNVHVVIEQPPPDTLGRQADTSAAAPLCVLPVSARSPAALARSVAALALHLETHPDLDLADVAHTLQRGRRAFAHRTAVIGRHSQDAIARLSDAKRPTGEAEGQAPRVVFMGPGQGTQHAGMGRDLYGAEPVYRAIIDDGLGLLETGLAGQIRDLLHLAPSTILPPEALHATALAQPALFLTQYATARLWMNWGIVPDAFVGHSIGELVCAALSGVWTFGDALNFVAERGRLMQTMAPGGMMAVRCGEAELDALLPDELSIAAINTPRGCVVSGPHEALDAFRRALDANQVAHRPVQASHAFHSAMMDPVVPALERYLAGVSFGAPTIPFVSGLTGDWAEPDLVCTPGYWARHCRSTIRFSEALATAVGSDRPVLIEMGAGRTLSRFAAGIVPKAATRGLLHSLPDGRENGNGCDTIRGAVASLWMAGGTPDWEAMDTGRRRRIPLPTYPFERQTHWIEAPRPLDRGVPVSAVNPAAPFPIVPEAPNMTVANPTIEPATPPIAPRSARVKAQLLSLLQGLSGDTLDDDSHAASFLDLGYDSLFLAQVATEVKATFGVAVTFRQLFAEFSSVDALAAHLVTAMPADPPPVQRTAPEAARPAPPANDGASAPSALQSLMREQLAALQGLFAQQLAAMGAVPATEPASGPVVAAPAEARATMADAGQDDKPSRLQVYQGAKAASGAITPAQRAYIDDLTRRYNGRTAGSKQATQAKRAVLADPRAASGFRQDWKEMVYPLLCVHSKGARITDIDGNDYVDLVNGYGQTAFGHSPDFVTAAVTEQLNRGFAIGPQSPLAGDVAERIQRLTGNERVTFCNTGSEAVMAAMRVARTVTGRSTVVMFEGAYHGQFDEVLVKAAPRNAVAGASPAAAGIPAAAVANMVVLPYGTDESLAWIRDHASSLAAVIVEAVQSRHPAFQPKAFLAELRRITEGSGTAFVFDEVVTGFRVHPGGMQAVLGIRADLATYGKVIGGGMPIGILAGKAHFMDALDGGSWRFGDDTCPEVAPTFFAGTFVRHPLALAATQAVLKHLEAGGPALQDALATRTAGLVAALNADLARRGVKTRVETFSSWFYFNPGTEDRLASLFFHEARSRGLHIQEGFPCFLTTAHTDADLDHIGSVFAASLDALAGAGILVGDKDKDEGGTSTAAPLPDSVPWTEPQKEVWLAAQLSDAASCAFNESVSLTFAGDLDEAALAVSLGLLVARHDALRATFDAATETMRVAPDATIALRPVDGQTGSGLQDVLTEEAATPFDLEGGPMLRAVLVRVAPETHVLVLTAHHIICDGWSINILVGELAEGYKAHVEGRSASLPAAPQFRRHALDHHAAAVLSPDTERFWRDAYATLPPPLDLPADHARPVTKSFRGATHRDAVDAELYRGVKAAGARQGCTLFVTLLAALQVLLSRLSGEDDVVIAVPTAGQSATGAEGLVGHCVNLLPLRMRIARNESLANQLGRTRDALLDAFEHQNITFGTLVQLLDVPRTPNRLPLTQIQFNLEKLASGPVLPGVTITATPNGKAFSNFDVFINFIEGPEGLRIDCDYSTDLFEAATIAGWMRALRALLQGLVEDAQQPIWQAPLLSPAERHWMSVELNATETADFDDRPVHVLVAAQAARTPDAVALVWRDKPMTYADLEASSNRLARAIREQVGAPPSRIAVATARSPAMVVAILAILKAGHAYVPIDGQQPAARQRMILDDAAVAAILCDTPEVSALFPDLTCLDIAQDKFRIDAMPQDALAPAAGPDGDDLAYVIFTSGSTGRPKGVAIAHRSLTNLLWSMARRPGMTAQDTLLAVTTIGFDIAGAELLLPLVVGGRVVIADRSEVTDGFALVKRIADAGATVVQATPSLWRILLEAGFASWPGLTMIAGGEALPLDLARQLLAGGGTLWNAYGPTETTIWSSLGQVHGEDDPITIGSPILNTTFHILDDRLQLCPIGVEGELFIGGAGLAQGYFRRDDLTMAAFREIAVPDLGSPRLYRTGDRVRRLADGTIQHLGRHDGQVKLRGFRIELEEIESVLRRCPGVEAAAVALRTPPGGEPRLVGYAVTKDDGIAACASDAARHLPDYMVPKAWMRLDALPLTPNGKLDRRALPDPPPIEIAAQRAMPVASPKTPLQADLVRIIADVLHVEEVGIEDNIFALGADSLKIFRIASRLRTEKIPLDARDLMQRPTVASLSEAMPPMGQVIAMDVARAPALRSFRRAPVPVGDAE
ncbi:amino acid adenylation domain-containing protein [Lichenihabitans sp. Uapishka_5]|uniref:non-ribosomal peptide synthetase/type I polyketide synthase n=1 Tax=Lichenihabitans sp. Uapishka_5 TaxID=3037302 RepID=UPI0029E81A9D|nr:non-ribosomal peptide synthetase/type I polyketide synthase [Lichenihabitans sp. Uapishka_5]MDX7950260.1 amino acid adenylation domain-containing protein [Lichenihabitans sp. Uapishka_5]